MTKRNGKRVAQHVSAESIYQFILARGMVMAGIPLMLYMAYSMWTAQATMNETLNEIKTSVALLKQQVASSDGDKYGGTRASADFQIRDVKLEDHEKRIDRLEQEMRTVQSLRGTNQ